MIITSKLFQQIDVIKALKPQLFSLRFLFFRSFYRGWHVTVSFTILFFDDDIKNDISQLTDAKLQRICACHLKKVSRKILTCKQQLHTGMEG